MDFGSSLACSLGGFIVIFNCIDRPMWGRVVLFVGGAVLFANCGYRLFKMLRGE